MLTKGIRKYISNPTIGLLPFVLYLILHIFGIDEVRALLASLILCVFSEIGIRTYYKTRGLSISFWISSLALFLTLVIWYFTHKQISKPNAYIIISEVFIVCLFMILRVSKTYIITVFFRRKTLFQKSLLHEFFDSATLLQYGLTIHIFGVMLYRQFTQYNTYNYITDTIVFSIIPIVLIIVIGIYQFLKVRKLIGKLNKEEWIPIITEKGDVTGKIAKSVSMNLKNTHLHPVVRVALISDSKVYLQERSVEDILNPRKLDYPFEKYMLLDHEINAAAQNSIKKVIEGDLHLSTKFVLKYVFENENTKRLIFLFSAHIDDEDSIKRTEKMGGKFWTVKQIEEGFADEIFSECFELEFEYLKHMVLLPTENQYLINQN